LEPGRTSLLQVFSDSSNHAKKKHTHDFRYSLRGEEWGVPEGGGKEPGPSSAGKGKRICSASFEKETARFEEEEERTKEKESAKKDDGGGKKTKILR